MTASVPDRIDWGHQVFFDGISHKRSGDALNSGGQLRQIGYSVAGVAKSLVETRSIWMEILDGNG